MTDYQNRLQRELETKAKRLDWLYARMHYYQQQIEVAQQQIEQVEGNQAKGQPVAPSAEVQTISLADADQA